MTTRYAAWEKAFRAEREACAAIGPAWEAAHEPGLDRRTRKARMRAMWRLNDRHLRCMARERAARARLSRSDVERAMRHATSTASR